MEEAFEIVDCVPSGKVCSYGLIGRLKKNRVSGLIVGNWLAKCPGGLPWWRIIGADGSLKINKKSPAMAQEQRMRLESEGVIFWGELVPKQFFVEEIEMAELYAEKGSKLPTDE